MHNRVLSTNFQVDELLIVIPYIIIIQRDIITYPPDWYASGIDSGPLPYSYLRNDLLSVCTNAHVNMLVDDSSLITTGSTIRQVEIKLHNYQTGQT